MRYAVAADFRTALEARLLARSRASGMSIVRIRKAVIFDRLLARLGEVAPGRWMLKGALALDYRFHQRARTTMDLDLGRHDDEAAATADLLAAQAVDVGDHFVFAAERRSHLDALQEARAVRFHVECELAGRPFDKVRLDIAFDPGPAGETELLLGPDLLSFADIPPVQVPAVALDQHVAEKLHAYTRGYGKGGVESSRVKDLVDLVLIADLAPSKAGRLRRALERTFRDRDQHRFPRAYLGHRAAGRLAIGGWPRRSGLPWTSAKHT